MNNKKNSKERTLGERRAIAKQNRIRAMQQNNSLPIEYYPENQKDFNQSWEDIEASGISFHQAILLYEKQLLSWQPDFNQPVTEIEAVELEFLFGIFFKSGFSDTIAKSMLAQLKKPYYYSHNTIYWNFTRARWEYIIPKKSEDEDALKEDLDKNGNFVIDKDHDKDIYQKDNPFFADEMQHSEYFDDMQTYIVENSDTIVPGYNLKKIIPNKENTDLPKATILRLGDWVKFKHKK